MTAANSTAIKRPLWAVPQATGTASRSPLSSSRSEMDADLLRRVGDGDRDASQLLVDQHLGRILNYAYRMLGDTAEAEDVAQETFLRLWRSLDTWRADAPLIHWLQRVAYNLCIDRLRRRRPISLETAPEPLDPAEGPAGSLHRHELAEAVAHAIGQLPERQRAAVVFVHQEGLSNIETAELMGISVDAVESLLARGRRSLRRLLESLRPELKGEL
jgi:RNA polymerase sigma-70 factor, ECF subfamily